jgi:hypothetical protein
MNKPKQIEIGDIVYYHDLIDKKDYYGFVIEVQCLNPEYESTQYRIRLFDPKTSYGLVWVDHDDLFLAEETL